MDYLQCIPTELIQLVVSLLDVSSRFVLNTTSYKFQKFTLIYDKIDFPLFMNRRLFPRERMNVVLDNVIVNNYCSLFKWLLPDEYMKFISSNYKQKYLETSSKSDSVDIFKYVCKYEDVSSNMNGHILISNAAFNGNLDLLKWLIENRCIPRTFVCSNAAKAGRIDIIEWLKPYNFDLTKACTFAAENNQFNTLKYLHEHGAKLHAGTFAMAAKNGRMDMLIYLLEEKCPFDDRACRYAAENNRLDILMWLRKNKCPWNASATSHAARNGHFDIVKYLHENGCAWDVDACTCAAESGSLEILKYLHENGCPLVANAYTTAVENGHLDIVEYLYENKCPLHMQSLMACRSITKTDNIKIWKLCLEHGYSLTSTDYGYVAELGHFEHLKWLHEQKYPKPLQRNECVCAFAARNGHLEILKWLVANGYSLNSMTCSFAAKNNYLEIIKWLHEKGYSLHGALKSAIEFGHNHIVSWLNKNGYY